MKHFEKIQHHSFGVNLQVLLFVSMPTMYVVLQLGFLTSDEKNKGLELIMINKVAEEFKKESLIV